MLSSIGSDIIKAIQVETWFWRIQGVCLRIEADLRTHQSALADVYLALPPRWLLFFGVLLLKWLLDLHSSRKKRSSTICTQFLVKNW